MLKNTCLFCNKELTGLQTRYCSEAHRKYAWKKKNWRSVLDYNNALAREKSYKPENKECAECAGLFLTTKFNPYQKYCSRKCKTKVQYWRNPKNKQQTPAICLGCNIEFLPKRENQKTCSRSCAMKAYHKKVQQTDEYRKKHAHHQKNRKHKIRANGGSGITFEQWEAIKLVQNFTCLLCGRREPEIKLTQDHVIAIKDGGVHEASNIQALCQSCNSRKD